MRASHVDLAVELGGGRLLTGTVNGLHHGSVVRATYSRLGPKHRLTAWVQLLAAGAPTAHTTGRGAYQPIATSTLTLPVDPTPVLRDLVALYDAGLAEPLPIATGASHTYAARRDAGDTVEEAMTAAGKEWDSLFGDGKDAQVQYVHESAFGAFSADGRFSELACRLWDPLLAAES